ncbi:MAG: hypothetical protein M0Z37_02245, partial [Nitrospiraceae bacterium]|nr:hypothetical protein [Nitrospiraceae bacterium]
MAIQGLLRTAKKWGSEALPAPRSGGNHQQEQTVLLKASKQNGSTLTIPSVETASWHFRKDR